MDDDEEEVTREKLLQAVRAASAMGACMNVLRHRMNVVNESLLAFQEAVQPAHVRQQAVDEMAKLIAKLRRPSGG